MSRTSKRQIIYKLYDVDNNFIRVLDEVTSTLSIEKNLFNGSAPINITISKKIDEIPADLAFNNKIKIYVRNKWSPDVRLVYFGYIISLDPVLVDQSEHTAITCLGAISKLNNDFLRIGDDLAYEIAPKQIDEHFKEILEQYRSSLVTEHGSADRSMIDDPALYWADTDYIEDTLSIGIIPSRYFNLKHLGAINEIGRFLPKNDSAGEYWYWYLNDEGRLILKKLSATADHSLILGKHCTVNMRNNIESLVNRVYFWNDRGDYAGERIRTKYEDSTSQNQYDVIADRITDSQVTTFRQGRLLAESKLMDNKDNSHTANVTVTEATYDILTFAPGQVVKILNTKDSDMFSSRMTITKVVIQEHQAVLSLSTPRPDLSTQVESDRQFIDQQLRWFGEITTRIDGSRIFTGVQHWITEDIAFNPDGNDKITWTDGTFTLSNDVKRVIISGEITGMSASTDYFLYLDEENAWSTKDTSKAAVESGTGTVQRGENFLVDSSKAWKSDQYKGYVLWFNPSGGDAEKHIITRNTESVLYTESHKAVETTDVAVPYEIHRFELRLSNKVTEEGTADSGSTTALVDSTRTEGDDHWNGFKIKILSGDNAGIVRTITSFTSNTFTFPALPHSVGIGTEYSLYLSSETQILITAAKPEVAGGQATIIPQTIAVQPEYQVEGATRASEALDVGSNLIKDVINAKLNTNTQQILQNFSLDDTDYAGALKSGTIQWSTSTGRVTSGTGFVINDKGILGALSGVEKVAILNDGTATFAGELAAGISITSPVINGGTITGSVIRTASSGARVEMKSELFVGVLDSSLVFYDTSGNKLGGLSSLDPDSAPVFTISGLGNDIFVDLGFNAGGSGFIFRSLTSGGVYYTSAQITAFGDALFSTVTADAGIFPSSSALADLGTSSVKWKDLHLSQDCYVERQIRLTPRTSAVAVKGSIMFFSTDDTLRVYDGTAWRVVQWT